MMISKKWFQSCNQPLLKYVVPMLKTLTKYATTLKSYRNFREGNTETLPRDEAADREVLPVDIILLLDKVDQKQNNESNQHEFMCLFN